MLNNIDLNQSFNKLKTEIMNHDYSKETEQQILNLSKAGAFDVMSKTYSELKRENERLNNTIEAIMNEILQMDIPEVARNPSVLVAAINKIYRESLNLKNNTL